MCHNTGDYLLVSVCTADPAPLDVSIFCNGCTGDYGLVKARKQHLPGGASARLTLPTSVPANSEHAIPGNLVLYNKDVIKFSVPSSSQWTEFASFARINSLQLLCSIPPPPALYIPLRGQIDNTADSEQIYLPFVPMLTYTDFADPAKIPAGCDNCQCAFSKAAPHAPVVHPIAIGNSSF